MCCCSLRLNPIESYSNIRGWGILLSMAAHHASYTDKAYALANAASTHLQFLSVPTDLPRIRLFEHHRAPDPAYLSAGMQARKLFSSAGATEIWDVLKGPLQLTLSPNSLRALVLLLTFFPHQAAATSPELPWHTIAAEAVQIWLKHKLNSYWDRLWLCFLSRIAKWDTHVRPVLLRCGSLSSHLLLLWQPVLEKTVVMVGLCHSNACALGHSALLRGSGIDLATLVCNT